MSCQLRLSIVVMYLLMIQIIVHQGTEKQHTDNGFSGTMVFRKGSTKSGSIMCCMGSEESLPSPRWALPRV